MNSIRSISLGAVGIMAALGNAAPGTPILRSVVDADDRPRPKRRAKQTGPRPFKSHVRQEVRDAWDAMPEPQVSRQQMRRGDLLARKRNNSPEAVRQRAAEAARARY